MIYNVPIEPLPERYSIQWQRWFATEFMNQGIPFHTVKAPTITNSIKTGAFLDVYGTNFYKAAQAAELTRLLLVEGQGTNDWVFFHDLWNPAVISMGYIRDGAKRPFKIAGCLHAGTWDPWDFLTRQGMAAWARGFERSLLDVADVVFVATRYHKRLIEATFGPCGNVIVTGFPIRPQGDYSNGFGKDPKLVVFPHRLDPEKRPDLFDRLAEIGRDEFTFVKTKDVVKTKADYYRLLAKATYAVSFAEQETWGIAMQEAVFAGCIPIVPDRLSYEELYAPAFRFSNMNGTFVGEEWGALALLRRPAPLRAQLPGTRASLLRAGDQAIVCMLREMGFPASTRR